MGGNTKIEPLNSLMSPKRLSQIEDASLRYALEQNREYRIEVNAWLCFFRGKGWLNKVSSRLSSVVGWQEWFSRINELKVGYFLERKLNFTVLKYEVPTSEGRNVDFQAKCGDADVYVEVKSPSIAKNVTVIRRSGSLPVQKDTNLLLDCLEKAAKQLPEHAPGIVVLCDDLTIPQHLDVISQQWIRDTLNLPDCQRMSAVLLLGNSYQEHLYEMYWMRNQNARHPLSPSVFNGYPQFSAARAFEWPA